LLLKKENPMPILTKREELIKALLILPEDKIDQIVEFIRKESDEGSYDITDELIQGIRELGKVLRGEMEAIPLEDVLNEL
jgi:uncharacterized protein YehS (DUF1456 family)